MAGVAEQSKIDFAFGFKAGEQFLRISAYAQDHRVFEIESLLCVTKLGRFDNSTGGVGFRIKKQNDALAAKVLERYGFAFTRFQSKFWSLIAGF